MNKIKTVLIGVGHLGSKHLKILRELSETVHLAGICDSDTAQVRPIAKELGIPCYKDYRKIDREIDAVDICTPTFTHFPIARFFLENPKLTAKLKALRHRLTQVLLKFPASYRDLLEARDSFHDVGKASWVQDVSRTGIPGLWISNMKRAQEALRVMEEFSKAEAAARSSDFQKMRFSLYELEKKSFRFF